VESSDAIFPEQPKKSRKTLINNQDRQIACPLLYENFAKKVL
jgi:hypothetical protein